MMHIQRLKGNWNLGWALDLHTVSSAFEEGGFSTVRTEIGEALYQLKYCLDESKVDFLAEEAASFLKQRIIDNFIKAIIAVPPSDFRREFQPVYLVAQKIGELTHIPVGLDYVIKMKDTDELKDIEDFNIRRKQLQGAFRIKDYRYKGKNILLFDDLYSSGATLTEITKTIFNQGKVNKVFVLTLTQTRTKR